MAIERLLISPFSYKVLLPFDPDSRSQKRIWCQQNLLPFLENKPSWVAPRPPSPFNYADAYSSSVTDEIWNFRREEDAVMFDMVWNDKIGGNSFT